MQNFRRRSSKFSLKGQVSVNVSETKIQSCLVCFRIQRKQPRIWLEMVFTEIDFPKNLAKSLKHGYEEFSLLKMKFLKDVFQRIC